MKMGSPLAKMAQERMNKTDIRLRNKAGIDTVTGQIKKLRGGMRINEVVCGFAITFMRVGL
jgi:hypothetical protein